jgi:hypothetical protein
MGRRNDQRRFARGPRRQVEIRDSVEPLSLILNLLNRAELDELIKA